MSRISKSERVELWLDRLQRHSQSGQSIAQFCAAESVSAPSFYQWKRRLAVTLAEETIREMIRDRLTFLQPVCEMIRDRLTFLQPVWKPRTQSQ